MLKHTFKKRQKNTENKIISQQCL